jgi:hypothetical protein
MQLVVIVINVVKVDRVSDGERDHVSEDAKPFVAYDFKLGEALAGGEDLGGGGRGSSMRGLTETRGNGRVQDDR